MDEHVLTSLSICSLFNSVCCSSLILCWYWQDIFQISPPLLFISVELIGACSVICPCLISLLCTAWLHGNAIVSWTHACIHTLCKCKALRTHALVHKHSHSHTSHFDENITGQINVIWFFIQACLWRQNWLQVELRIWHITLCVHVCTVLTSYFKEHRQRNWDKWMEDKQRKGREVKRGKERHRRRNRGEDRKRGQEERR